jgi:cation diffusion facilitator CzcD-associated flavoprotein CzcO
MDTSQNEKNQSPAGAPIMPEVSPRDIHNETLMANVRPPDWVNPEPARRYNLVVIGGGTAGLVTAAGAAGLGARVALVKRHLLGGDCLNYGCVPSKTIIRSSRVYAEVRQAREMISEITAAMVGNIGLGTLASVIHPYPTQAEAIRQAGDLYNRTRLTPLMKNLFARFLRWWR